MVLNHVTQCTGAFVIRASLLHPQALGRCDLDMMHIIPVPERLKNAIGKAGHKYVLNSLLSKIMVNAEKLALFPVLQQQPVQMHSTGIIIPERLFDNQTLPAISLAVQTLTGKTRRNLVIYLWRNGEIKQGVALNFHLRP